MRFIFSIALSLILLCGNVFAASDFDAQLKIGMDKYKKGDTKACLKIMETLSKEDPVNSYVNYYMAISYAKLGETKEAKNAYEKVIMLNEHPTLVSYSRKGLANIDNSSAVKKKLERAEVSKIAKPSRVANKPLKTNNDVPTDEEIANAIKVLKKAGILNVNVGVNNPYGSMGMPQNNDLMQMNMLMGGMGGSKNKGMDMMPFLMMQAQNKDGNQKNITPEIMQVMMNNMMLDGMTSLDLSKNK